MTIQNIIAALIILGALAYTASLVWKKLRAFSPKNGCASGCGCGAKTKKISNNSL